MRIAYYTDSIDQSPAGIGRYAGNLLKTLARAFPDNDYTALHFEKSRDPLYGEIEDKHLLELPGLPKSLVKSLTLPRWQKWDIVHDPSQLGFLVKSPKRYKTVLTVHDIAPVLFPETYRKSTLFYSWAMKRALKNVDAILVPSTATEKDLVEHFSVEPNKIVVTPEGVESEFKPAADKEIAKDLVENEHNFPAPYILYVGTIEPRKNVEALLDAFKGLSPAFPHRLVLVGKRGWKSDSTIARIQEMKRVTWLGYVDSKDLITLYQAADCFVFPSMYEGFGLPPLEAMACGCPVVTSNVSSLPEVVGGAGVLIDPESPSELTSAINRVIGSKSVQDDMSRLGIERAKMFTWEGCAELTHRAYESLLS